MSSRRWNATWIGVGIGLVSTAVLAVLVAASARAGAAATEVETLREARYPLSRRESYASEARDRTQQAESLVRVLAHRAWPADSLLMLGDSAMPAWQLQFVTTQLRRSWAALAPRHDGIRVVVAFVPWLTRAQVAAGLRASPWGALQPSVVFLPELLDGRTCLVLKPWAQTRVPTAAQLAALEAQWLDESAELPPIARSPENTLIMTMGLPARRATLGACGWLAAYGPPGRGARAVPWS